MSNNIIEVRELSKRFPKKKAKATPNPRSTLFFFGAAGPPGHGQKRMDHLQVLPRFLLPLSLALPLTYGYDIVRGYLLNTKTLLPIHYEIAILLAFMGVMIPVGYAVFREIERRCKTLGTIGLH